MATQAQTVLPGAAQTTELKVAMACGGCENAVRNVLKQLPGVQSVDVSLPQQKVTVRGTASREAVFNAVKGSGKATEYWS